VNIVKAISISPRKGMRKKNIEFTRLIVGHGLEHDAHAGKWHRQVSFLAEESITTMRKKGLDVVAGNFAENITTEGLDLPSLPVGKHLKIGEAELVISQLGKICHTRCAIYHQAGDCVMPREGIFAVVVKGGDIKAGDTIESQDQISTSCALVTTEKLGDDALQNLTNHLLTRLSPSFVRVDTVKSKEGGSLPEILEDLTVTQKISTIVVVDPQGLSALSMAGLQPSADGSGFCKNESLLYYCRSVKDAESI